MSDAAPRGPWWRPPRPRTIIKVHLVEEVAGGFRAFCGVRFTADALAESRTQLLGECTCGTCRRIYTLRASKGKA